MLVCLVLAFLFGAVHGDHHGTWKYPEDLGNGWSGTCQVGQMQSPIDLSSNMSPFIHAPITFRNYFNGKFNKHYKGLLKNNGNTVVWYGNHWDTTKVKGGKKWKLKCPSIRDGPYGGLTHTHAYYLYAIHFHWGEVGKDTHGSEHTIDGMAYPLEMHMIHVEDRYIDDTGKVNFAAAADDAHGLSVLAILFKVVHWKVQNQEPLETIDDEVWKFNHHHNMKKRSIEEVETDQDNHNHELNLRGLHFGLNKLTETKRQKREIGIAKQEEMKLRLNPGAFIKKALNNGNDKTLSTYWTYKGSLTTPGCNEAVTWVVFSRPLPVAQVQVNAFASLYPNNYRTIKNATAAHDVHMLIHDCLKCKCNNGMPFETFARGG